MTTAAYTPSSGPEHHACISSTTASVIHEIVSLEDRGAVHLGEACGDPPGRQPLRIQGDRDRVDVARAPLPLRHDHRLERVVPVPRHLNVDLPRGVGQDRLAQVTLRIFPLVPPAGAWCIS